MKPQSQFLATSLGIEVAKQQKLVVSGYDMNYRRELGIVSSHNPLLMNKPQRDWWTDTDINASITHQGVTRTTAAYTGRHSIPFYSTVRLHCLLCFTLFYFIAFCFACCKLFFFIFCDFEPMGYDANKSESASEYRLHTNVLVKRQ